MRRLTLHKLAIRLGVITLAIGCSALDPGGPAPGGSGGGKADVPGSGADSPYRDWTADETTDFFHRSTGGRLLPTDWFLALELPGTSTRWVDAPDLLRARYGLIPDPDHSLGLPLGWTDTYIDDWYISIFEPEAYYIGFNCAACHTGEIHYQGETLLVPGGSGRIDVERLVADLRDSLHETAIDWPEGKYDRFADAVDTLGGWQLPWALETFIGGFDAVAPIPNVVEGFGRSDTVSKGASAFAVFDWRNRTSIDAPVSVPALWNTHLYSYRHYTGSIRQALGRDISATLGGGAGLSTIDWRSSVDLDAIRLFEQLAAVLAPPAWPAPLLGEIDAAAAARGAALYADRCGGCHPAALADDSGELELPLLPLAEIGTDPAAAEKFASTIIYGQSIGIGNLPAADALQVITTQVQQKKFDDMGLSDDEVLDYTENGRPNEWRAPLAYRAAPLAGVWATPPYLHNGSVPTLDALLTPAADRPAAFRVCADTEYDPARVGLAEESRDSCPRLDTAITGNSAAGHDHGTDLAAGDRADLIEYLKTL